MHGCVMYCRKTNEKEISKKKNDPLHPFQSHPKIAPVLIISKNRCSFSMVMSSSAGKSTERRIQKDQNILTYPIHFLPHPKTGPGTKMTQDDLKPKNVPNYNFLWSAMFSDMLHQKHWRLKLSPKQLAHYYHSIRKLKSKTRKVNRKLNTKLEGLKWLNYKIQ